jgi:asparagine synthase (glutamine-hydrolysing)
MSASASATSWPDNTKLFMSVQTGIISIDGRQIAEREINFLLFGLEERAPDYANTRVDGRVGMGFRGFRVTPEDTTIQPHLNASGATITFDGRLDRRVDLALRLGLEAKTRVSDVVLVAMAFGQFGEKCFSLLIGEFALTIWDQRRQLLYFARSLCGSRPLYFLANHREVLWSSEFDDLVLKTDIDVLVNDAYAIGFAYYQPDQDEAPFSNVRSVSPGACICIDANTGDCRTISKWVPQNIRSITLGSDAEYEEAWRTNVESAIADKLRTIGPVVSELSGGLDSSTIVLLSDHVLRAAGRDTSLLTTVSHTYETSRTGDESFFIRLVEEARGASGFHITEDGQELTLGLEDAQFTGVPNTSQNFPGIARKTISLMNGIGARVLFNGVGGDELFWTDGGSSPILADMLAEGRVYALLSEARKWSHVSGKPLWRCLLAEAIDPIEGFERFTAWQRPEIPSLSIWGTAKSKQWLCQPHKRFGLRPDFGLRPPSRRTRVLSIRAVQALLNAGYFSDLHGVHVSHPFTHQALVEFVLSLPMEQIARPADGRSLMRRALRGILPEQIRVRRSKGSPDEAMCRILSRDHDKVRSPATLRVCERAYVDAPGLAEALYLARLGRLDKTPGLIRVFSLERWLRSLDKIAALRSDLRSRFGKQNDRQQPLQDTSVLECSHPPLGKK